MLVNLFLLSSMASTRPFSFATSVGQFPPQPNRTLETSTLLPFSLRVTCNSRVTCAVAVDISKRVSRLKKQGIEPTPKILHHLRKKEMYKVKRKERKEREKAEKMGTPVEYTWSEADSLEEKQRLMVEEAGEERTDDFLCFVHDERPARRITLAQMPGQVATEAITAGNEEPSLGEHRRQAVVRIRRPRRNTFRSNVERRKEPFQIIPDPMTDNPKATHSRDCEARSRDWEAAYRERFEELAENPSAQRQESEELPLNSLSSITEYGHTRSPREQVDTSSYFRQLDTKQTLVTALQERDWHETGREGFLDVGGETASEGGGRVSMQKRKKGRPTEEFKAMLLSRRKGDLKLLMFDDDLGKDSSTNEDATPDFDIDGRSIVIEDKKIQSLVARLNETDYSTSKVHFAELMHSGGLKLTEDRVLRIVQILGELGNWRRAMQVVQWVHNRQQYKSCKSRYVYTTLLSVLGKAHRPVEALNVFSVMRESFASYPDIAAYHSVAVTLGQAGYLKELLELIEDLKVGPKQQMKNVPLVSWDPCLFPDIVVYNAVLNACVPSKEWRGALWSWEQLEKTGISPNGATFGLTIEVMVKAGKYEYACRYFNRMERAGFPPNAQTYKSLIEAFGRAGRPDEAIGLVDQMEVSGTVGTASVYFALACSLCMSGRLQEALVQVRKMQEFPSRKSNVITYTGLIQACQKAGRIQDAIAMFEHMKQTCAPNVETCNVMIKLYGQNSMFKEARSLYEGMKKGWIGVHKPSKSENRLTRDVFTYESMLKASAVSEEWNDFEHVYKEMTLQGHYLGQRRNLWLMMKLAKEGKIDLVDNIIHQLKEAGEVPDPGLYRAQILSCLHEEWYEKAMRYLKDMISLGLDLRTTLVIIQDSVRKDNWDRFLQQVIKLKGFDNRRLEELLCSFRLVRTPDGGC